MFSMAGICADTLALIPAWSPEYYGDSDCNDNGFIYCEDNMSAFSTAVLTLA